MIDETATLTKVRADAHACSRFLDLIEQTKTVRIEWINPGRFETARHYFRKYLDHAFSFTDCVSFQVMRELQIAEAVTRDAHFLQAGFVVLLK